MGRRPELKSDETHDANVIVIEIDNITIVSKRVKPLKQLTSCAVIGGATSEYCTHTALQCGGATASK